MELSHGNVQNARRSMGSKENLLIALILFLFIGGLIMGFMTGLNY
jgi:hypothetical protein